MLYKYMVATKARTFWWV